MEPLLQETNHETDERLKQLIHSFVQQLVPLGLTLHEIVLAKSNDGSYFASPSIVIYDSSNIVRPAKLFPAPPNFSRRGQGGHRTNPSPIPPNDIKDRCPISRATLGADATPVQLPPIFPAPPPLVFTSPFYHHHPHPHASYYHPPLSQLHPPYSQTLAANGFAHEHPQLPVQSLAGGATKPTKPSLNCPECNQTFKQRSNLNKHIRTVHLNERPFACSECDVRFGHKNLLLEHQRTTHRGERPFVCTKCGLRFGRRSNKYQHEQLVHARKRNFHCSVCPMSFGLKGNLTKHVKLVHEKQRPHACDKCDSTFGLKSDLRRHINAIHPSATSGESIDAKNGESLQDPTRGYGERNT